MAKDTGPKLTSNRVGTMQAWYLEGVPVGYTERIEGNYERVSWDAYSRIKERLATGRHTLTLAKNAMLLRYQQEEREAGDAQEVQEPQTPTPLGASTTNTEEDHE